MKEKLKILPVDLLKQYRLKAIKGLKTSFDKLKDAEISTDTFNFYTSVSAIASSRIEGEQMEVDSYIKHKMLNIEYQIDWVQKPNDLFNAYMFGQQNSLTESNLLKAHALLSKHLLPTNKQGVFRKGNTVVLEHKTGRIQYEAALGSDIKENMKRLWQDIRLLKKAKLSYSEVFYFASFIHMVFVNIHPFEDGNGRSARLLEKWFVAQKLGKKAWYMQSELNYYTHVNKYYKNLNRLGMFYDKLDYLKAMPFLLMLPKSLALK